MMLMQFTSCFLVEGIVVLSNALAQDKSKGDLTTFSYIKCLCGY
jgi:hypothetical protein